MHIKPSLRHALAALCLYGQPFGFTQEDVDALLSNLHDDDCGALWALYDHECTCHRSPTIARLQSLAARIAALLPPSDSRPETP